MRDRFKRQVDYLRISVTDRCNMRCQYCMPAEGMTWFEREDILSYEEITRFVQEVAVPLGITKLRLTGGEPLVRRDLHHLVAQLAAIPEIKDIAMTTNGAMLDAQAAGLKAAGLQRINVSMDSLQPERFKAMTRGADLARVWRGIEAAMAAGFAPIKLNCVVMAGFNEDELVDFVRLTLDRPIHVRFIEFMPVGDYALFKDVGYVSSARMRELIQAEFALAPIEASEPGNGPARYWQVPGAQATVGFISQMSHDFCASCNRIRLTADGKVRHCLLSDHEIDVRTWLRDHTPPQHIQQALETDIQLKAEQHDVAANLSGNARTMSQIGG